MNVELSVFEDAMNRVSPYTEMRNAEACDAHFKKFLDNIRSGWQCVCVGGEYRMFTVTEAPLPTEMLTARP